MQSILIVEDEEAIARVLSAYLRKAGFHVTRAADGRSALDAFEEAPPSLVLLDIMLPAMDGFELLQLIRERSSCPVIMLTARDGIKDRLAGLDGGADDYMSKPFIPEEVVARVKAVLRRPSQWSDGSRKRHYGSLFIDFSARSIFLNGAEVSLSPATCRCCCSWPSGRTRFAPATSSWSMCGRWIMTEATVPLISPSKDCARRSRTGRRTRARSAH